MRSPELGSKRIVGLDIVRSVAILAVMFSHYLPLTYHKYVLIRAVSGVFGVFGVELFFVLSGFLIGGILIRDIENGAFGFHEIKHFWKRRWFRTLPNYYLFLLVNVVTALLIEHRSVPDLYKYLFFWQNLMYDGSGFYGVSWSLCIEEWVYLLLPICCFLFL